MAIFLSVLGFIMIMVFLFGSMTLGWYYTIIFLFIGILYFCLASVYSLLKELKERLDKLTEDK